MGENTSKTCDWQWVNLKKKKKIQTVHAAQYILKKKKIVSNTNYKRSAKQPSSHQKPLFCFPEDGAVTQGLVSLTGLSLHTTHFHFPPPPDSCSKDCWSLLSGGLPLHNTSVSRECQGLHSPAYLAPCGGKWGSVDCDSLGSLPLEF